MSCDPPRSCRLWGLKSASCPASSRLFSQTHCPEEVLLNGRRETDQVTSTRSQDLGQKLHLPLLKVKIRFPPDVIHITLANVSCTHCERVRWPCRSPRCRRLQPADFLLSRGHLNTSPVCFCPVVSKGAPTSSLGDIKSSEATTYQSIVNIMESRF